MHEELEIPVFLRRSLWTQEDKKANDRAWKSRLAAGRKAEEEKLNFEVRRRKRGTLENKIASMKRRTIEPGTFQARILASLERQLKELGGA